MSITASYRRLPPEEFEQLRADSKLADAYFGFNLEDEEDIFAWADSLEASGRYLSIDKMWHGLHFLLTGSNAMDGTDVPPPLDNVVMGGTDTDWEATYGMV